MSAQSGMEFSAMSTCSLQAELPARFVLISLLYSTAKRCIWKGRDLMTGEAVVIKAAHASAAIAIHRECSFLRQLPLLEEDEASGLFPQCIAACTPQEAFHSDAAACAEDSNAVFMVQTALTGDTLDVVARNLPAPGLVPIAKAALLTLDALWKRRVAHRDLSGANILVDRVAGSQGWMVRLVDFDAAIGVDQCLDLTAMPSTSCAPTHLLPAPPWTTRPQPITYNVPPELYAAATSSPSRDRTPLAAGQADCTALVCPPCLRLQSPDPLFGWHRGTSP